jgi:hypothetical protein
VFIASIALYWMISGVPRADASWTLAWRVWVITRALAAAVRATLVSATTHALSGGVKDGAAPTALEGAGLDGGGMFAYRAWLPARAVLRQHRVAAGALERLQPDGADHARLAAVADGAEGGWIRDRCCMFASRKRLVALLPGEEKVGAVRRTVAVELQMGVERGLVEELQCIDALQQGCHPLLEELVEPAGVRARRRERFEDVLQLLKRHLSVCFARTAAALLLVRVHDRVVVATVVEVRKADSVEGRSLARCPCLIRLVELRSDLRSDGSVTCST